MWVRRSLPDRRAERGLGVHVGDARGRRNFSHFLKRIGLRAALTGVLPSPFDYERNARIYLPQGLPDPGDDLHLETLLAAIWPLVEAARGGAFLLFTSYRALQRAPERWLEGRQSPGRVLVQGRGSRSELLNQFRADGNAILLGTGSFWQGVDVHGEALRLVIINKLPFALPTVRSCKPAPKQSRRRRSAFDELRFRSDHHAEARLRPPHSRLRRPRFDRARRSAPAHARLRGDVSQQASGLCPCSTT